MAYKNHVQENNAKFFGLYSLFAKNPINESMTFAEMIQQSQSKEGSEAREVMQSLSLI